MTVDLLRCTSGFQLIKRAPFDQEHLALWNAAGGEPGSPDDFAPPQYVYGWGRSNHVSGKMVSVDWYERHSIQNVLPVVEELQPRFDGQTKGVLDFLSESCAAT